MSSPARIFRALAHPTRRDILAALRHGELAAGEIGARFAISAPSVSRHLAVLKDAELVSHRREANRIIYRLEPERLAACLSGFIQAVCPVRRLRRKAGS